MRPQDAHKMVFVEVLRVDPQLFLALPPSYLPSAPLASSSLAGGMLSHLGSQLARGQDRHSRLAQLTRPRECLLTPARHLLYQLTAWLELPPKVSFLQ